MSDIPIQEIVKEVKLEYLGPAIALLSDDLSSRLPEEDYKEIDKAYRLLCDLASGEKWVLSKRVIK